MKKLYNWAKRLYQRLLEKRILAKRKKGTVVFVPDDMCLPVNADKPLVFGIIGTGHVFDRWMHDALMLPKEASIRVKGVCAGRSNTANEKASKYGIPVVYKSYEEMLADPEIDAVYVATPNHMHSQNAVQALNAGKHVLCEKPVAVNTAELREMHSAAEKNDRLCMEGMWMRTLPIIRTLQKIVSDGEIGDVKIVSTRCCNSNSPEKYPAMYSAEKAGGALMDVGCYGLHFARLFLSGDTTVSSTADICSDGIDRTSTVTLKTENAIANVTQSIVAAGGACACIHGTRGYIEVPMFLSPSRFEVIYKNGDKKIYKYKNSKEKRPIGYAYEMLNFADCVRNGRYDSELIPIADTIAVAETMELVRREWGVALAGEIKY